MLTEQTLTKLAEILFPGEEEQLYAVLDGASILELLPKLDEYQPDCYCLFPGELSPDMAEVAPYLVHLQADSPFTEWVLAEGWGKHWGSFAMSKSDFSAMRNHLRKFIRIRDEKGKLLYFRFYDPRVLGKYLPTCTNEELKTFFGEITRFIIETENGKAATSFYLSGETLKTENIFLED
jgi:hypothetical protein